MNDFNSDEDRMLREILGSLSGGDSVDDIPPDDLDLLQSLPYLHLSTGVYVSFGDIVSICTLVDAPQELAPSGSLSTVFDTFFLPELELKQIHDFLVSHFPSVCIETPSGCLLTTQMVEIHPVPQSVRLSSGTVMELTPSEFISLSKHLKSISVVSSRLGTL